jgi:hypothetical protein
MNLKELLSKFQGLFIPKVLVKNIESPKMTKLVPGVPKVINGAVVFVSGAAIDADGDYRAYSPKGSGLPALDYLANAGKPGNYYGLVCVNGEPVVQGTSDPAPGYYVSPTALSDHFKKEIDPKRYLNSSEVPYIAIPPDARPLGVHLGDVCVVFHKDFFCGAIVGDVGPRGKFGEISIKLAENLSIPSSPKNGGVGRSVRYVIFPGSSKGWPRVVKDIQDQAMSLYQIWGGSLKLEEVFGINA